MFLVEILMLANAAVTPVAVTDSVPMDSPRWRFEAQENRVEQYLGRQSLFLRGGWALLEDVEMLDGVIEFDVAIPKERGFSGAVWRVQDQANMEQFYLRHHQSGNPDANQYTPVFNGLTGWQLYHGEGYGTPVNYEFDTWIPVRIVVSGHQAEMYIKDLQHPVLFADELKREPVAGAIALTNANFAGAHFSNFRYSVIEEPILKGVVARERVAPEGAIMSWSVSTTFDEAALGEATELSTELLESLAWNTLQCESTGVVNVSKLRALARGQNTVLASISLSAKQSTRAVLSFGYSDRVRVYLNGSLLYSGNNGYRSRDYRYLGTIGLFDTVVVSLNEGRNELAFAVSETFGGWGLKAVLDSSDGISVNP